MIDTCNNCKDFLNWRKDLELKLQAADELAKAARYLKTSGHEECGDSEPKCPHKEIGKALAAYEKVRGVK